jgi:hypothetical protein
MAMIVKQAKAKKQSSIQMIEIKQQRKKERKNASCNIMNKQI